MSVARSPLDEARFGIASARSSVSNLAEMDEVMTFCEAEAIRFLIARCPAQELRLVQHMEQRGFLLMDTLLYYARRVDQTWPTVPHRLRLATEADAEQIKEIAVEAFRGYGGHYHADARLDPALCDDLYVDWAYRSCTVRGVADAVLVSEDDTRTTGFVTLRRNNPMEGEIMLSGVSPAAQGQGLGRSLIIGALDQGAIMGMERMIVSTQITNLASQKIWSRLGFDVAHAYYTFHRWFD
ncbi:MAG: GNAT family N-acetyltransferase [Anaerolineae bacterium]|nr:GNAT family N-acetyltransferase [Anaerolineae bacterium]